MKKVIIKNGIVYVGTEVTKSGSKILENGTLLVTWTSISCSCDDNLLNSDYFNRESHEIVYGEASSPIDRAIELALTRVNGEEIFSIDIEMEGRLIDDNLSTKTVIVCCIGEYKIVQNGKRPHEYSAEELLAIARRLKEKSNILINSQPKNPQFKVSAIYLLERSLKWLCLIQSDELDTLVDKEAFKVLQIQCCNNMTYLHLFFEKYEAAIRTSTFVIDRDANNVKALYRRAVANTHLQNYEVATNELKKVLSIDPTNSAAKNQLQIIVKKQSLLDGKYAQAMRKFILS